MRIELKCYDEGKKGIAVQGFTFVKEKKKSCQPKTIVLVLLYLWRKKKGVMLQGRITTR